jgi:hypothetical protein
MLIVAIHQTPSLMQERYEEVVRRLTGKRRIEAPSDQGEARLVILRQDTKSGQCPQQAIERRSVRPGCGGKLRCLHRPVAETIGNAQPRGDG